MSNYPGRIITKNPVTISTTQASGIWTLQQALFGKKSSADLLTSEVDDVQRVIGRHLAETHDIDVPFGR